MPPPLPPDALPEKVTRSKVQYQLPTEAAPLVWFDSVEVVEVKQ